jgi:hypothetical protein
MQIKSDIEIENIKRMSEIAEVYEITRQGEKSARYHRVIIMLCDRFPKNEELLQYKIQSLNRLDKSYKSLETTDELLDLNPNSMAALINIARHIKEGLDV